MKVLNFNNVQCFDKCACGGLVGIDDYTKKPKLFAECGRCHRQGPFVDTVVDAMLDWNKKMRKSS